jgi:hypothetical protein
VRHPLRKYIRTRYTATGALAALAAVGAIAGSSALASPHTKKQAHVATSGNGPAKTPVPPTPTKAHTRQPGSDQPFLNDAQQLVSNGTITSAEGQTLATEIRSGTVDTGTLVSDGFTAAQIQAVQHVLTSTKESLSPTRPPRSS